MIRYSPDSISEILRATHIVGVRVLASELSPPQEMGSWLIERRGRVDFAIEQVWKGDLHFEAGSKVRITLSKFEIIGPQFSATPGIWSRSALAEGDRYLVFAISDTTNPHVVLSEPWAFLVVPEGFGLPDVEIAREAGTPEMSLRSLLTLVGPRRSTFTYLFANYIAARLPEVILGDRSGFHSILKEAEHPETSPIVRRILINEVFEHLMLFDPAEPVLVARLVWGSMRLLITKQGAELRVVVMETLLPNLLGIEGGLEKKSANRIFERAPQSRAEFEDILRTHTELPGRERLLEWLAS